MQLLHFTLLTKISSKVISKTFLQMKTFEADDSLLFLLDVFFSLYFSACDEIHFRVKMNGVNNVTAVVYPKE